MSGSEMPPGMTILEQKKWKSAQFKKKIIKVILGLAVKLFVIVNLVRLGPQLLNIFVPWKWHELAGVAKHILLNIVLLMVYCVFVNKSLNPVMCMIKF